MNLPSSKPSLSGSPAPSPLNIFPFVKGECGNCGVKERWLLHNVVVRGVDRRICTSCVLRLHPSSFCPCCFEFYEHPISATSSSSAHRFVSCVKCSSLSHIHCLSSPPPSPYLCPPCSKPNFTFFPVPEATVDVNLAKIFFCAAKIASAFMKKQFTMSNVRCERAVKEAAMARKRTKESIEQCFTLQRLKDKDSPELANTIKSVCKKEEIVAYGVGYPQSPNGPLSNKIGTNGIGSPAVMNKIGANGNDGRIGNNGGRFGAAAFKASA